MKYLNNNQQLPTIQLLITACAANDKLGTHFTWLHGYCLLTFQLVNGAARLDGEVLIGERYSDNLELVRGLACALDPEAVLAGLDLTAMISRLGRLPIDAPDQRPSLELLSTLKVMLERQSPIDLTLNEESARAVEAHVIEQRFEVQERLGEVGKTLLDRRGAFFGSHDNLNRNQFAVQLADTASAWLLAIGDLYLPKALQPSLLKAWRGWRRNFSPLILDTGTIVGSNLDD